MPIRLVQSLEGSMKRWMLTCFATLSLLLVMAGIVATPTLAKPGGNTAPSAACAGEGYLNYMDANGKGFTNERQCARYEAEGNTLLPRKTAVLSFEATSTEGVCLPVLTVSGYEPRTHVVVFGRVEVVFGYPVHFEVDKKGDAIVVGSEYYDLIPEGTSVIVYVDGMPETTGTATC